MFSRWEIQVAEQVIKNALRDTGKCDLSVDEIIYLYKKTGTWDITQWPPPTTTK